VSDSFDLVVIGGGPGGYVAALRAGQLGLRTACIDKRGAYGGTCLHVGCIPSKALLHSSERYAEAKHELADHGIAFENLSLDLERMMARKREKVAELVKGIAFLLDKNAVETLAGTARISAPGRVEVELADGGARTLETQRILSPPAPTSRRSPACRSTRSASSPPPAPSRSSAFRKSWWWWAPAPSASSSAACGRGSAPR
jgi:dihydrolipoamide dehydrogenase